MDVLKAVTLDVRATSDAREMVTEARARELLSPAFSASGNCPSFTRVALGGKSYSREASKVVAEALKLEALAGVTAYDLADIIAGRPEEEALEVLMDVVGAIDPERAELLDLSDNALGEKGVRALMGMLGGMKNLHTLLFHNNGLSELSVSLIAECLQKPSGIKVLEFDNNMSGSGGAIAVAALLPSCPSLVSFRMSSSRVRPDGGEALCKAICDMPPTLRHLDVSDSMYGGEETGIALASALRKQANLETINLKDCGIEEDGLDAVLEALAEAETAPRLEVLNLSCLELGPDHCTTLCEIIKSKPALKTLILDENEFDSEGAVELASALKDAKCTIAGTLRLRENVMGSAGAIALAKVVASWPGNVVLDIDGNQIAKVERLRSILGDALGPMDENDPDMDEDEDGEDEEENAATGGDADVDDLAAALEKQL